MNNGNTQRDHVSLYQRLVAQFAEQPHTLHRKWKPANPLAADLCLFIGQVALTDGEMQRLLNINRWEIEAC